MWVPGAFGQRVRTVSGEQVRGTLGRKTRGGVGPMVAATSSGERANQVPSVVVTPCTSSDPAIRGQASRAAHDRGAPAGTSSPGRGRDCQRAWGSPRPARPWSLLLAQNGAGTYRGGISGRRSRSDAVVCEKAISWALRAASAERTYHPGQGPPPPV